MFNQAMFIISIFRCMSDGRFQRLCSGCSLSLLPRVVGVAVEDDVPGGLVREYLPIHCGGDEWSGMVQKKYL